METFENITASIFSSCDVDHADSVRVSLLIEFIKPYTPDNCTELLELQALLDPESTDPCVNSSFFNGVMSDWIAKTRQANDDFSANFNQTFSLGSSALLSCNRNNNNMDTNVEEEKMQLKLQLNKANANVELLRQQLSSCEEQNESLVIEINKLKLILHNKEQWDNNNHNESVSEVEYWREQLCVATKRCEQLEKSAINSKKEEQKYLDKIAELQNENQNFKKKLEYNERTKREDRRSIADLQENLESKEAEISTLQEAIAVFENELADKADLLNFYQNDRQFLKEKTLDLEHIIHTNTPPNSDLGQKINCAPRLDTFNTPKLLKQLSQPISPTLNTPFLRGPIRTSSPLNGTFDTSADLSFANIGLSRNLRSPHKTLQEELKEVPVSKLDRSTQVKHEENTKNKLWEEIRQSKLNHDLLKKEHQDLLFKYEEQNKILQELSRELKIYRHGIISNSRALEDITDLATTLEINLNEQRAKNANALKDAQKLENILKVEKIMYYKHLHREKLKRKKVDQNEEISKINVSETVEKKSGNFTKQQMKIDKLTEKCDKAHKELLRQMDLNAKLRKENEEIQKEAEISRDNHNRQKSNFDEFVLEHNSLLETLQSENDELQGEIGNLKKKNSNLDNNLQAVLSFISVGTTENHSLRANTEFLLCQQRQLEAVIKEQQIRNNSLEKQIVDEKSIHDLSVRQFQAELSERETEINNLKFEDDTVQRFLQHCNDKIRTAILNISECFNFNHSLTQRLLESTEEYAHYKESSLSLETEILMLKNNIRLVDLILQDICDKHLDVSNEFEVEKSSEFLSCYEALQNSIDFSIGSETYASCTDDEAPEISSLFEYDSMLGNIDIESLNFEHLSHEEAEEKLSALVLSFTMDDVILRKKTDKKEAVNNLIQIFFTHLNHIIKLISKIDMYSKKNCYKPALNKLQKLKDVSKQMLQSAVVYGALRFEKKTAYMWKLALRHISTLQEEKNKFKQTRKQRVVNLEVAKFPGITINDSSTCLRSNLICLRFMFLIYVLIIILIFGSVVTLFYVDHLCSKAGQRVCPIQWMVNLFREKTHSSNIF